MTGPSDTDGTGARKIEPHEAPLAEPTPGQRLIELARIGEVAEVRDLLRTGTVDINHVDPDTGFTALHYAAAYDARRLLRLLVAFPDCDFTIPDRKGRTAASLAYEVAENSVTGRFLLRKEMQQRRQREGT